MSASAISTPDVIDGNSSSNNSPKLQTSNNVISPSTLEQWVNETMILPVIQKTEKTVFARCISPTRCKIVKIYPDCTNYNMNQTALSRYGDTKTYSISPGSILDSGDYCILVVFDSSEVVNSIKFINIELQVEPVTNHQLAQMLMTFQLSLGFEPSHLMNYKVQSNLKSNPFYRRTRAEVTKVLDALKNMSEKSEVTVDLTNVNSKLDTLISTSSKYTEMVSESNESHSKMEDMCSKLCEDMSHTKELCEHSKSTVSTIKTSMDEIKNTCSSTNSLMSSMEKPSPGEVVDISPVLKEIELLATSNTIIETHVKSMSDTLKQYQVSDDKSDKIQDIKEALDYITTAIDNILSSKQKSDVVSKMEDMSKQLREVRQQLTNGLKTNDEKGESKIKIVSVSDIEQVVEERNLYLDKLTAAEDYIDDLERHLQK